MIQEYAVKLAEQSGIQLSGISVVDGRMVGCNGAHPLHLTAEGNLVSVLVHQSELDELQSTSVSVWLEQRIRSALSRLQTQMTS